MTGSGKRRHKSVWTLFGSAHERKGMILQGNIDLKALSCF
jgi:hypothetical protein